MLGIRSFVLDEYNTYILICRLLLPFQTPPPQPHNVLTRVRPLQCEANHNEVLKADCKREER